MAIRLAEIAVLFLAGGSSCMASDWPPLPEKGFIVGRPASVADVENGDAVFVAAIKGTIIGKPLPIDIPQYGLLCNTNEPVIVVQAEEANGMRLMGVRGFDGKETVTTEAEIELLGRQARSKQEAKGPDDQ